MQLYVFADYLIEQIAVFIEIIQVFFHGVFPLFRKAPFGVITEHGIDLDQLEAEILFGFPAPFVIDRCAGVIDGAASCVDLAGQVTVLKIHEVPLVKSAYFTEKLRADKHEAARGVLDIDGLREVTVEHCVFAQGLARLAVAPEPACDEVMQGGALLAEDLKPAVGEPDLGREHADIGVLLHIVAEDGYNVVFDDNVGVDYDVIIGVEPVHNKVMPSAEADIGAAFDNGNFGVSLFYMLRGAVSGAVIDHIEAERSFGAS